MWADWDNEPHRHFYIKEVARLRDGRLAIPMRWICVVNEENEQYCADLRIVSRSKEVSTHRNNL